MAITIPVLFIFNWLWTQIYALANEQVPSAVNIPSSSLQAILTFIQAHIKDFSIMLSIYLVALWGFSIIIQLILKWLFNRTKTASLKVHYFSIPIIGAVLLNSLALVPFAMIGYRIPFVNLIKLPDFVSQVLLEKSILGISVTSGMLVFCIIVLKGSQTITNIMCGQRFINAIKNSWHDINIKVIARIFGAILINLITLTIISGILYELQRLFEIVVPDSARFTANLLIVISSTLIYLLTSWLVWQFFTLVILGRSFKYSFAYKGKAMHYVQIGLLALVCGGLSATLNNSWFPKVSREPLVISHRGSNGNNGVPNSIPSLANTIKYVKPDYVEMDIQFTKDHQFVVLHDTSLKALTGVNIKPYQLTLKEITALTMKSKRKTAKIPSFDEYLAYATAHKQKLLVELKMSLVTNPAILKAFVNQFGTKLAANHAILHSLNKNLVKNVKQNDQKVKIGFILPYNTDTLPKNNNAFYTVEYSTLTSRLVNQIHHQNRQVYAWTANDKPSMKWLSVMNVDAIITDYPARLQAIIKQQHQKPTYAPALLRYMLTIQQTF